MAMDLAGWAEEFAAQLHTRSAVPVVIDERDLTLPGALLLPAEITPDRLTGNQWQVTWSLILLTPEVPAAQALQQLTDMASAFGEHLQGQPLVAGTYNAPNHASGPLPALTITLTTDND